MNPNDPFYHLEVPRARHFVRPEQRTRLVDAIIVGLFILAAVGVVWFNNWVQS